MILNCQILPLEKYFVEAKICVLCCVLTENDFKINHGIHIHGYSISSLYALRNYDPVLLGTTGYNHKIYCPRMQVCDERGRGPCKR